MADTQIILFFNKKIMAFCTICGSVYHDQDMDKHACDPVKIPNKGEEIQVDGTKINIETKQII